MYASSHCAAAKPPLQVRSARLTALLLTHVAFKTCGGLPGAVITCAEAARSSPASLTVAGPPKLGLFMNALAAYSDDVLQELKLNVRVRTSPPRVITQTRYDERLRHCAPAKSALAEA